MWNALTQIFLVLHSIFLCSFFLVGSHMPILCPSLLVLFLTSHSSWIFLFFYSSFLSHLCCQDVPHCLCSLFFNIHFSFLWWDIMDWEVHLILDLLHCWAVNPQEFPFNQFLLNVGNPEKYSFANLKKGAWFIAKKAA